MVRPVEPIDQEAAILEKQWLSIQAILMQIATVVIDNDPRCCMYM